MDFVVACWHFGLLITLRVFYLSIHYLSLFGPNWEGIMTQTSLGRYTASNHNFCYELKAALRDLSSEVNSKG